MNWTAVIMIGVLSAALAACSEMPAEFRAEHASPMLILGGQFAQGSGGSSGGPTNASPGNDKRPRWRAAESEPAATSIATLPVAPAERIAAPATALHRSTTPTSPPPALPTPW
jgi:hypothetical protein